MAKADVPVRDASELLAELHRLVDSLQAGSIERLDYHYPPGELGAKSMTIGFSHLIYFTQAGERPDVKTAEGSCSKPQNPELSGS